MFNYSCGPVLEGFDFVFHKNDVQHNLKYDKKLLFG